MKQTNDKQSANSDKRPRPDAPVVDASDEGGTGNAPMRIAKYMARAGLCSRREAERWIEEGRVQLNGKVLTTPAVTVTPADKVIVDNAPMPTVERTRLWLLHKSSGTVTTNKDPEGRTTIFKGLPDDLPRVLSVGRLDINTEGLLLLTNDGGLARALELPSTGWLRRYRVRAHGMITQERLDTLKDGIAVDGVLYGSIEAELERVQGTNVWLTFAMREGKNREVKKVLAALDLDVNRLIRISYGPFQLGDLPKGQVREVRGRTLRDQLGDKLIKSSGAQFDAPLIDRKALEKEARRKAAQEARAGGDKPAKKRGGRGANKADPLSRLDTKKPVSGKPGTRGASGRSPSKKNTSRNSHADRRR